MERVQPLTIAQLRLMRWAINIVANPDGSYHGIIGGGFYGEQYQYEVNCPTLAEVEAAICSYGSFVSFGYTVQRWAPGPMMFPKEHLRQWISQAQMLQFEEMYDDVVMVAYENAKSYVISQMGHIFDLPVIFRGESDESTNKVMSWILEILTAWNICAAGMEPSMPLQTNWKAVCDKITEIKNGATTMGEAPIKPEPNAMPKLYSRQNSYRG